MLYECLPCWLTLTIYKWPKCNLYPEHKLEGGKTVQKEIISLYLKKKQTLNGAEIFNPKASHSRKTSYEGLLGKIGLWANSISYVQYWEF